MVDVPHMDHLWDGQKDCPDDKPIIWGKEEIPRSIPHCMLLRALWQSCHGVAVGQVLVVTEVWYIAHCWVSYGRYAPSGSPMGRSEGLS